MGNLLKIIKTNWAAHAPSLGLTTTEEEEETTKKPSTDNKEAIDRQQRGHRQPSSDNRPETATNNHSHECMCVCGCMFVDVFAHIHTSKGEKSKKGLGGSARAQFGAPLKGTQRKVAVFLHETQFPLLCVF